MLLHRPHLFSRPGARYSLPAALLLVGVAVVVGCEAKLEQTPTIEAGIDANSDAEEASSEAGGLCQLTGDQCTGDSRCCPPFTGYQVDLEQKCRAARQTPLSCRPPSGPAPDLKIKRCLDSPQSTCFWREVEAGAAIDSGGGDAGSSIEVYWCGVYRAELSGFMPCDSDLYLRAMTAQEAVCP